ncbi:MAG: saccharopine dehydrogenase NADP-binding domain-containing protein [Bacteroidetes bacterium]|nr:saccharopine dehydrogenase NADP-binding domain-containing protein [Bacteroidota bacterium]MBS1648641.1 saccharopine dehydrogenase NADP-binding domain-containing protein [Bacteroidota bacterium]
MQHILLIGAGKSATVLINYLKNLVQEKKWQLTVADNSLALAEKKIDNHAYSKAVQLDINNATERKNLIEQATLVISMLPAHLHYLVAVDCVALNKNLLTASYVSDEIKNLEQEIKNKGLLFLCEMGLDPGIDHMSAMQMIDTIKAKGGIITSFKSHCGGLVAPESDNNPWHYKISWNAQNVVLAGKAGALYKKNNNIEKTEYINLFNANNIITINQNNVYAYYANRNSLNYISLYGLETCTDFIRTTLRHPDFCLGWKNIIDLKLTDEEKVYETNGMSIQQFFMQHFEKHGFSDWLNKMLSQKLNAAKEMMETLMQLMKTEEEAHEQGEATEEEIMLVNENGELNTIEVEDIKTQAAETIAVQMHDANLSMKQLLFLGMNDNETLINKGLCSAADVLQFIMETKLVLADDDKDMIIMLHEIDYTLNNNTYTERSLLKVIGENAAYTAMAKTVGLPLAIAAKLILEGKITDTGLHIPTTANFYEPVLKELEENGIVFEELQ